MAKYSKRSEHTLSHSGPAVAPQAAAHAGNPDSSTYAGFGHRLCLHGVVALILVGVCALLYSWTADFPLVVDGVVYLQNNPLVRDAGSFGDWHDIREFVARPNKLGLDPDLATNFILRPAAYLTFHLNYLLDGFAPRWYRAVNIVIHAGNSILVYALLTTLLGGGLRGRELSRTSVFFIAATAALLFAVHPLATESVTYIVQRFTSLGALFYLLTLWLYFVAGARQHRTWRWLLTGAAVVTLLLGMLTKECTITAPFLAVFLDRLMIGTPTRKALTRAIPLLLCVPLIPSLVLLVAWGRGNGVLHLSAAANLTNSMDRPLNHWHYLVTQFTVVVGYLWRLIWPSRLNIDPEWPTYRSLLEGPVVRSLVVIGAVLAGSWQWLRRHRQDARVAGAFAFTVWFFATIVISSGLVTLPDLMAEHRSYLPSVGIFAALACMLDRLRVGRRGRWLCPAVVMACAVALGVATWQRNEVWRTNISLWKDTVEKSPGKFRVWNNLGDAYAKSGNCEEAVRCFKKTIVLEPLCWAAHVNLAGSLNGLTHYQESYDVSMAMLKANPITEKSMDLRYNVGVSCLGMGRVDKGIALLKEMVTLAPTHRPSKIILGLVYSQTHQPRKALDQWQQAAALEPASPALRQAMQKVQDELKREETGNLQASRAIH